MKRRNLVNKLTLILASVILLASCSKKEVLIITNPVPLPAPVSKKLWKIKTNDNDSTLFAYTTTGQLFKVISTEYQSGDGPQTYSFMYDSSYRITEISSNAHIKFKFVYIDGQLNRTENYTGSRKVSESIFQYEGSKLISTTVFTAFPRDSGVITYLPTFKTIYSYDAAAYPIRTTSYNVDSRSGALTKINEKEINEYDQRINPLAMLSSLTMVSVFEISGKHNIINESFSDERGQLTESTQHSYVYDADQYPVSSTSVNTSAGGSQVTTRFTYSYK